MDFQADPSELDPAHQVIAQKAGQCPSSAYCTLPIYSLPDRQICLLCLLRVFNDLIC